MSETGVADGVEAILDEALGQLFVGLFGGFDTAAALPEDFEGKTGEHFKGLGADWEKQVEAGVAEEAGVDEIGAGDSERGEVGLELGLFQRAMAAAAPSEMG